MDYTQISTVAIALLAVIISFVSLHRSGIIQRQQFSLQEKQEELVSLQLEMLRKQAAMSDAPAKEKADIRVDLVKDGRNYGFVITNWGRGAAQNVRFNIKSSDDRSSPLVKGDYDQKVPIRELSPRWTCLLLRHSPLEPGRVSRKVELGERRWLGGNAVVAPYIVKSKKSISG
jgi:hypothetical protein